MRWSRFLLTKRAELQFKSKYYTKGKRDVSIISYELLILLKMVITLCHHHVHLVESLKRNMKCVYSTVYNINFTSSAQKCFSFDTSTYNSGLLGNNCRKYHCRNSKVQSVIVAAKHKLAKQLAF